MEYKQEFRSRVNKVLQLTCGQWGFVKIIFRTFQLISFITCYIFLLLPSISHLTGWNLIQKCTMTCSPLKGFTWQETGLAPAHVWPGKGSVLSATGTAGEPTVLWQQWTVAWETLTLASEVSWEVFYVAAVAQRHHLWPSQLLQLIWHQSGLQSSVKDENKAHVEGEKLAKQQSKRFEDQQYRNIPFQFGFVLFLKSEQSKQLSLSF